MAHIVVIGAGFGGLAAAVRLQAQGHRVTVCEQAAGVGGKLGTYVRDGFRFDTGPSVVTLPQVFSELFAATGDPLGTTLGLRRVDPHYDYRFAGAGQLTVPADPVAAVEAVTRGLGPDAGRDWAGLMHRAGRMWDASREDFVEAPGPPRLLPLARRSPADLPVIAPGRSLRRFARQMLRDQRLRAMLERYATYSGSDPGRAPAALASTAFVEQAYGCWYVDGGLHQLALALADRLAPGALRLQTPVSAIQVDGGRVSGVRLGSRTLACDAVVSDADARALYGDLLARPALIPRGTPSFSGFVLLLGLDQRPPGLAHHTVLFPDLAAGGYAREFTEIFAGRPAADPAIYVSAPTDPAIAPAGAAAAFVLVNAPIHGRDPAAGPAYDWTVPERAARYADHVLDLLADRGLDLRERMRFVEIRTPADLEGSTWSPGGAIYGPANHGSRATFRRAANRSPVPGLFLTGGSAHPGGGLPLVALSARAVAGLVGPA